MDWSQGVSQAIETSKAQNSPLLVLVEPAASVLHPPDPANESPKDLLCRVATEALHKHLFGNPAILKSVHLAKLHCLRLQAEQSKNDYVSFSAFFHLENPPPNLFLIAPNTGVVLYRLRGYVAPSVFQKAIFNSCKTVSSIELSLPPLPKPTTTSPSPAAAPAAAPEAMPSPSVSPSSSSSRSALIDSRPINDSIAPTATNASPSEAPTKTSQPSKPDRSIPREVRLQARLPDGRQVNCSLSASASFSEVRSWLSDETQTTGTAITISTSFPRYIFVAEDDQRSLEDLGLAPSSSLVVILNHSSNPSATTAQTQPWRVVSLASSAASVLSSFARSFVVGTNEPTQENPEVDGPGTDSAHTGPPQAVRMTERRTEDDRDGQWMSNGNSTQFGWNPDNNDDDQPR